LVTRRTRSEGWLRTRMWILSWTSTRSSKVSPTTPANSASQRFVADYLAGFALAAARMKSVVAGLQADREGMARNLANAGGKVRGGVLAEPAYILLAESGISDAHEVIRRVTLDAETNAISFFEALKKDADSFARITAQLGKLGVPDPSGFFENPERYRGLAAEKAERLAARYRALMEGLGEGR